MPASKIWIILLAGAAMAGFGVARLIPRPAAREIGKAYAENLDRGQQNADLILRLEARDWIDAVTKMAWDDGVVDLLDQAGARRGDLGGLRSKLNGRLQGLISRAREESRPQLIIAVDHRGKQIARIGPGEDQLTPGEDGLAGYPLVEAALRGYRTDDTWSLQGKLLMMVASPVISRSRGRYVGALLVGLDINDAFARRLKSRLGGTDLAFFLRDKLVASSASAEGLQSLPQQFHQRRQEIAKHERSAVVRLGPGPNARTAILAALPGEAATHDAFYAAVGAPVPAVGLGELLAMVGRPDLRWGEFPWPLVLGLLVIAVAIGLALMRWEHDAPLRRLMISAEKLGKAEATRLDEFVGGGLGRLARALNEAHDLNMRRGATAPAKESRPAAEVRGSSDLDELPAGSGLDAAGVQPLGSISGDFPAVASRVAAPGPSEELMISEPYREELPTHRERAALSLSVGEPSLPGVDAYEAPPAPGSAVELPGLNLTVTSSRSSSATPPLGGGAAAFELEPGPEAPPAAAARHTATGLRSVRPPEPEETDPSALPLPTPAASPQLREDADVSNQFAIPEAPQLLELDPDEDDYHDVYKDFLAVKQQCGESTSALTYKRFVDKLRANRETLMQTYNCKSVKFQVYVKDGKAALKATPVKD